MMVKMDSMEFERSPVVSKHLAVTTSSKDVATMWRAQHTRLAKPRKPGNKQGAKQKTVQKRRKPQPPKPEWDASVNDLNVFKLSREELEQRLAERVSKNRVRVQRSGEVQQDTDVKHVTTESCSSGYGSDSSSGQANTSTQFSEFSIPEGWCLDLDAIAKGMHPPEPRQKRESGKDSLTEETENQIQNEQGMKEEVNTILRPGPSKESTNLERFDKSLEPSLGRQMASGTAKHLDRGALAQDGHKDVPLLSDLVNLQNHEWSKNGQLETVSQEATTLCPQTLRRGTISITSSRQNRETEELESRDGKDIQTPLQGNKDLAASSSKEEVESLRKLLETLQDEQRELKSQVSEFMGHTSRMMTSLQSQIQKLLSPPRNLAGEQRSLVSQSPASRFGEREKTGFPHMHQSLPVRGPIAGGCYPIPPAATAHPIPEMAPRDGTSWPAGGQVLNEGLVGRESTNVCLPSYAEMRRSQLEPSVGSGSEIPEQYGRGGDLGCIRANETAGSLCEGWGGKGGPVPAATERGTFQNVQNDIKAATWNVRQNVPGPWMKQNQHLPLYPPQPPSVKSYGGENLEASVSLRAHVAAGLNASNRRR